MKRGRCLLPTLLLVTALFSGCNIYVGVDHYKTTAETYIRVLTAKGFAPTDNGERADLTALSIK